MYVTSGLELHAKTKYNASSAAQTTELLRKRLEPFDDDPNNIYCVRRISDNDSDRKAVYPATVRVDFPQVLVLGVRVRVRVRVSKARS